MLDLNTKEYDKVKEVINISLSKAADVLAFFVKKRVLLRSIDLTVGTVDDLPEILKGNEEKEELTVLTTKINGQAKGVCFLIFKPEEVEELLKVSLPKNIYNKPEAKNEFGDAMLLEVDNILAASVITQFSNLLKLKIFGMVPQLDRVSGKELLEYIPSSSEGYNDLLCFKTQYRTDEIDLSPEFIWLLESHFVEEFKNVDMGLIKEE